jgi:pilus assembly protein CpaB
MANLTKIAALLLVAVALLLSAYAWNLSRRPPPLVSVPTPAAAKHALMPVVVAVRALPAGQPIPADALRVESLPMRTAGTFSDPVQLSERVPVADIEANTPVFEAQLSSGLADRIAPGERAVAMKIEESNAVGNRLRPGNVVDVFFTLKREAAGLGQSSEVERTQARLLLSKIRILAFGPDVPGLANSNAANQAEPGLSARTAVLAVPAGQVDRLTLAETAGHLVLALRNPQDTEVLNHAGIAAKPLRVAKSVAQSATKTTVQRDSSRMPEGVSVSVLARAAKGISLSELSESRVSRSVAAPSGSTPKRSGSIEVIRGGRVETVAY